MTAVGFEFNDDDGELTIESAVDQALIAVGKPQYDFDDVAQALIDYLHGIDYLYLPKWDAER